MPTLEVFWRVELVDRHMAIRTAAWDHGAEVVEVRNRDVQREERATRLVSAEGGV